VKLCQTICQEQIHLPELKHQFYNSLGYQYSTIRSLVWKILLEYLPDRKNKWISFMETNKKQYERMLIDTLGLIIKRRINEDRPVERTTSEKLVVKECKDHPLNRNSDSQWNTYFKDI